LVTGPGDSGKSFCFKPLTKIFDTFIRRGQGESFPLQGLHGSEVCVLQDVRYESFGLPWDDWLCWGEDEDVMVKLPRNHFEASAKYSGSAPLFATMANVFQYPLQDAQKTGRSVEKENGQFRSRWTIVTFVREIPPQHRDISIPPCPRCAAQWYASAAGQQPVAPPAEVFGEAAAAPVIPTGPVQAAPLPRSVLSSAPATPSALSSTDAGTSATSAARMASALAIPSPGTPTPLTAAASPPASAAASTPGSSKRQKVDSDVTWTRLCQLMAWQQEGRLSETEFSNAKMLLGL
jgi:hypothetical protein